MTEKSEALRLADAMSLSFPGNLGIDKAAAELRRLAKVEAQRDVLLRALRPFAAINASVGFTYKDVDRARAAIKSVEGE